MTSLKEQHREEVAALCERFGARRLDVFGSAVRTDFDPATSDLDFLVEFDELPPGSTQTPTLRSRRFWSRSSVVWWTSLHKSASKTPFSGIASSPSADRSMHADARKLLWDAQRAALRARQFTRGKTFSDYY
jgi:hypothetical protein